MMNIKVKEVFLSAVEAFVEGREGRYREFVSDKFLAVLLLWRLQCVMKQDYPEGGTRLGNDAYEASVTVFERFLENECRVIGNGHHVAQKFSSSMVDAYQEHRTSPGE